MQIVVLDANGGVKTASSGSVVTSVGLSSDASYLTIGSTPVTSSGTITANKTTGQAANKFVATPTSGTGTADLRLLSYLDIVAGSMVPIISRAIFSYTVASGTNGGTYTTGSRQTRPLNTSDLNNISGASLGSNQVTLPAGTYRVRYFAQSYAVNGVEIILRNTTDSSDVCTAISGFSASGTAPQVCSREYEFTIAAQKVFQLDMLATATRATDGMGTAASAGVSEVFTYIAFDKVA